MPRLAVLLPLALVACAPDPVEEVVSGRVLDLDGWPVAGAVVSDLAGGSVATGTDGTFQTAAAAGNRWIRVEAGGYHPRTRAAMPGRPLQIRLEPDDGETLRLVFGGDTMFGRRYLTGDGDGTPPRIRPGRVAEDVTALLEDPAAVWAGAHLVSVNLEGPVSAGADPHPTKDWTFTSLPGSPEGLAAAGVGLANLGNNHVYDFLEEGLDQTLRLLDGAGLPWTGAGADEAEAWTPAVVDARRIPVAFVGCTTITGVEHADSYVADDDAPKGGAAACEDEALEAAVAAAAALAPVVVVQLHAGYEYDPAPSDNLEHFADVAIGAGAHLVVAHHPHVLGGLEVRDGRLVAWSLGNLAFDQDLWDTFPTGLLEVHLGPDGSLRRATLEPLLLEDYVPRGVAGAMRDRTARRVAARSTGEAVVDDGAVELDLEHRATTETRTLSVSGTGAGWSFPEDVRDGGVTAVTGADRWRVGQDLLGVGEFEDEDLDARRHEGLLWVLDSGDESLAAEAAWNGATGLRLIRDFTRTGPVVTNPTHRLPLGDGEALTVAGHLQVEGTLDLQVSWYDDTEGASFQREYHLLEGGTGWSTFQVDLAPPAGAVAVGVYLRLHPPARGQAWAHLDDLRVVSWAPEGTPPSGLHDAIQVQGEAVVTLERRVLPGSGD